jgi:hypothetical protein
VDRPFLPLNLKEFAPNFVSRLKAINRCGFFAYILTFILFISS